MVHLAPAQKVDNNIKLDGGRCCLLPIGSLERPIRLVSCDEPTVGLALCYVRLLLPQASKLKTQNRKARAVQAASCPKAVLLSIYFTKLLKTWKLALLTSDDRVQHARESHKGLQRINGI
jgi:hypothetical protein